MIFEQPTRRPLVVRVAAALALVLGLAGLAVVRAEPAAAAGAITFEGRGWGHGRGMSQYGSQGYATTYGWSSEQILSHFYAGTHHGLEHQASSRPIDPGHVRIRLLAMDQQDTITIGIGSASTFSVTGASAAIPSEHKSLQLRRNGDRWEVWSGTGCASSYTKRADSTGGIVTVGRSSGNDQLFLCRPDGIRVWYPGSLRGWTNGTTTRTINITTAEQQLRGIVPHESPASWHANALRAQSVAARSYLLAGDTRHSAAGTIYADTCDTTLCQVYRGHAQQNPGGTKFATTDPRTDARIAETAGVVRLTDGTDRIARTEFHSSSGGWTAGGTFPAVQDLGDSISPRHTWSLTRSVAPLESAYGDGGTLTAIEVTKRNGLGAMGGRVIEARLRFNNGVSRLVSGDTIRSRLNLYSNWFTPLCAAEGQYINAAHQLFLGRSATPSENEHWCPTIRAGDRSALTNSLAVSDEWAGVQIRDLYQKILGRAPDSSGYNYWIGRVRAGMPIEEMATFFYGGAEYFARSGGTNAGFIDRLYKDLLGRRSDTSGRQYWVRLLERGMSRTEVAAGFYDSIESRESRVNALYRQILRRDADSGGLAYWAEQIRSLGDVALAAYLAASQEYYNRVT